MRIILTLAMGLCFYGLSSAQVFVNLSATGNNDGSSWADAYTNLQMALDSAAVDTSLWVAAGTYLPDLGPTLDSTAFVIDKSLKVYGGFNGTETMLSERDWVANATILNADLNGDDVDDDFDNFRSDNARHVLVLPDAFSSVTVDGFTMRGGAGLLGDIPNVPDFTPWLGGGVLSFANLNMSNCTVTQNMCSAGGALFANSMGLDSDKLVIDNCSFSNNISTASGLLIQGIRSIVFRNSEVINNTADGFGGGLVFGNGSAIIEGCLFENNQAPNSVGGGLFGFINPSSPFAEHSINIQDCTFKDNEALIGAGFTLNNFTTDTELTVDKCIFSGNVTAGEDNAGGGMVVQNVSAGAGAPFSSLSMNVTNSSFERNSGEVAGGMFVNAGPQTSPIFATFNKVEFDRNTADESFGGIVFFNNQSFINVSLDSIAFTGNSTEFGDGGALGFLNNSNEARLQYTLVDCVFDKNTAEYGGAIWSEDFAGLGATGQIRNSLFSENSATYCCGAIASISEDLRIDRSTFIDNSTMAMDTDIDGGGALLLASDARVTWCTFEGNSSPIGASAIAIEDGENVYLGNLLLEGNTGAPAIHNQDSLWIYNTTFVDNTGGLSQDSASYALLQNNIFDSVDENFLTFVDSTTVTISNGGNVSTDTTFNSVFVGVAGFDDFNSTDPNLDMNLVPEEGSVCVDNGKP